MGRNSVSDINSFFFVITSFVKKLVKWCKQNGTSSSSLNVFGKTLKIPKNKVEDPWITSKQIWKPPNF